MRRLLVLLVAGFALMACSKEGAVFYTAHYPVTRLEVEVTLSAANAEAEEEIRQIVLQDAPVQVGGGYQLDFNRFDGGILYVRATANDQAIVGDFTKQPAAKEMHFAYGEEQYTVQTSRYIDPEDASELTLLTIDVTEHYRTALQDESILKVTRKEYTAYPAY
ncbi:MAG: hypothetical protein IKY68_01745 [Alistipes sp.]|nr:hypothetical protein [Alistipes sp.]